MTKLLVLKQLVVFKQLLVLIYILSFPYHAFAEYYLQEPEEAVVCYVNDKNEDECIGATGRTHKEVCWCAQDNDSIYCKCKDPRFMSKQEELDRLIYLGKEHEDEA